jgi:hypothetical protein
LRRTGQAARPALPQMWGADSGSAMQEMPEARGTRGPLLRRMWSGSGSGRFNRSGRPTLEFRASRAPRAVDARSSRNRCSRSDPRVGATWSGPRWRSAPPEPRTNQDRRGCAHGSDRSNLLRPVPLRACRASEACGLSTAPHTSDVGQSHPLGQRHPSRFHDRGPGRLRRPRGNSLTSPRKAGTRALRRPQRGAHGPADAADETDRQPS